MARYIDVEKAEYPYMSMSMFGINSKDCRIYNEGVKATEDMIQALPTADVVEVVKCSNCKYAHFNKDAFAYSCKRRDYYSEFVKPTDYCSYGERVNYESSKTEGK